MRKAFLLGIRLYFRSLFQAMGPWGRSIVPLSGRRLLFLLILFPLFLGVQVIHWIGFLIDEILFRGYRKTEVRNPLFITGIPRSGTTFLHRTLAKDKGQFTTFRTWEAILAPSITERKCIKAISWIDNLIGRPLHRLMEAITRKITGGFSEIHAVGLGEPEEDYLSLLPAAGCFIFALAFPANPDIWLLGRFQDMPDEERKVLIRYYKSCLQKHQYVEGKGRRLLSKNAAFASWVPDLRQAFPDARFIFCIREPKPALTSQLSSVRSGIDFFATDPAIDTLSLEFQTVLAHSYRILRDETLSFLPDHLAIIDQGILKESGEQVLQQAARRLCLDMNEELMHSIKAAGEISRSHVSQHNHEPLQAKSGPNEFIACVQPLYEEMIAKSVKI